MADEKIEIPKDYLCPITHELMFDPVILVTGEENNHTYEREAIENHLKHNSTDPITRAQVSNKIIVSNSAIKSMISSFIDQNNKKANLEEERYFPQKLVETTIKCITENDTKNLTLNLSKDTRLLKRPLKDNKTILPLVCELGSLEALKIVVEKLPKNAFNLPDKGMDLFLSVSKRLGVEAAEYFSKILSLTQEDYQNLLITAVKNNDVDMVKISLALGAIATKGLLEDAYAKKQKEIVKALILSGAPILEKDNEDNDFFLRTVKDKEKELTLFLLTQASEKIDINVQNNAKQSALNVSILQEDIDVATALVNHPKIDLSQIDAKGNTVLHIALNKGLTIKDKKTVTQSSKSSSSLMRNKKKVVEKTEDDDTTKFIKALIDKKIDLNKKNGEEQSVLDIACTKNDFHLMKLLILSGANVGTLLLTALEKEQSSLVKFLLTEVIDYVDLNLINSNQENGLMLAIKKGQGEVIALLLPLFIAKKITLNQKDANGHSVLDLVYAKYDLGLIKKLIHAGVGIDNLLLKAIENNQVELIRFLLNEVADRIDPNILSSEHESPLILAVKKAQKETIILLLRHPSINIHHEDNLGNTALHYAAISGNQEIVGELLKQHALVKKANKSNQTPLDVARINGHIKLCQWMIEEYRRIKFQPFLSPLKSEVDAQQIELESQRKKIKEQAEKIEAQEKLIRAQKAEIEELKKQVLSSKNTTQEISKDLSFFTLDRKEAILQQEKIMQKKKVQSAFIDALNKGDLEQAKKLELPGISLTEKNDDGLCPLAAAVYGANLKAVRYIESKLEPEEAEIQWQNVDVEKAILSLKAQMPGELPQWGATYKDIGQWYINEKGKFWNQQYDERCISLEGNEWLESVEDWHERGLRRTKDEKYAGKPYDSGLAITTTGKKNKTLVCPSREEHNKAVAQICTELNEFQQEVKTKATKKPKFGNFPGGIFTQISRKNVPPQKARYLTPQQNHVQENFVAALLAGDFEKAKALELEGALITEPNKEWLYPLQAAIYGANWDAVKHLEEKLEKKEAESLWGQIDVERAKKALDALLPGSRPESAKPSWLGHWYQNNAGKCWCKIYDNEQESNNNSRNYNRQFSFSDWKERGQKILDVVSAEQKEVYERNQRNREYYNNSSSSSSNSRSSSYYNRDRFEAESYNEGDWDGYYSSKYNINISSSDHDARVKQVTEYIEKLKNEIDVKSGKQIGKSIKMTRSDSE